MREGKEGFVIEKVKWEGWLAVDFATYLTSGMPELVTSVYQSLWLVNAVCAAYCMDKAQETGKKIGSYFILGSLLGPIGAIIAKVNTRKL